MCRVRNKERRSVKWEGGGGGQRELNKESNAKCEGERKRKKRENMKHGGERKKAFTLNEGPSMNNKETERTSTREKHRGGGGGEGEQEAANRACDRAQEKQGRARDRLPAAGIDPLSAYSVVSGGG